MRFFFHSELTGVPWAGSEELWAKTALALARTGHAVAASVDAVSLPAEPLRRLTEAGVAVRSRRPPGLIVRLARKLALSEKRTDPNWGRSRPDLAVLSLPVSGCGAEFAAACRRHRVRYAVIVQNVAERYWPADSDRTQLAEMYQGAARCYFVSEGNRRLVESMLGLRLERAEVVRNPFGVPYESGWTWPDVADGFLAACVARLEPWDKGQDLLLHALAAPPWRERPLTVDFYGTGACEQGLKALAELLKLSNVRFRGYISDVERIWREHHLLILPSRNEGLPIALVEALLCGRPAVVTDVAGNAEVVQDGVTGYVAPAAETRPVAEALERAWAGREQWAEMGRRAAAAIRQLVPGDPAAELARRLVKVVESGFPD